MENTNKAFSLFSDFPSISSTEWKNKILEDLKGGTFEKLIWEAPGELKIQPFFRLEDLENISGSNYNRLLPGSEKKQSNKWKIQQEIQVSDFFEANLKSLSAISQGSNSICFIFPENCQISNNNLKTLLQQFPFQNTSLSFEAPGNEEIILDFILNNYISEISLNETAYLSLNFDPFGKLASTGNFYKSEVSDFNKCRSLIKKISGVFPHIKIISVNSRMFHNAGATPVQELALSLASVSDYLDRIVEKDIPIDVAADIFRFNMASGPLYFIEIAKFRAARCLFSRLIKSWGPSNENAGNLFIHAETSEWNHTIFNSYVNILRGTTEAMSAILGGVDSLTIIPFGSSFRKNTEFDERIARNTQIILKEEAFFDKVIDPAAGSWYIENITQILTEKAWQLFLEIEKQGGYYKSFKSGLIQKMINDSVSEKIQNIAVRKEILTGTNQFPNFSENPDIDFNKAFNNISEFDPENIIAEPVYKFRASRPLEELRFMTLKNKAGIPKVFLLGYGNSKWYISRAQFAASFFGCAGYEINPLQYFSGIEEGIETAITYKASIVVLCSSDDQYAIIAPKAKMLLNDRAILVVAGLPKDSDNLKSPGIEYFIHAKSDLLAELRKFHQLLGINHNINTKK